jgi:uncharacterized damage-inducible protein DinB
VLSERLSQQLSTQDFFRGGENMEVSRAFLDTSRFFVSGYWSDIQECLNMLSTEELWWRPNDESNSIGNLLLHILGSLSHWILGGIGGAEIRRTRAEEFDRRSPLPKEDLLSKFHSTLQDVDRVFATINPSQLNNKMRIAGKEITWMAAIYLTIQHISMHTGQIILVTKLRTGKDLALPQFIDQLLLEDQTSRKDR